MSYIRIISILFCCLLYQGAIASHIAGGEIYYRFLSTSNGVSTYQVTLRLFRECTSNGPQLNGEVVNLGIYDNATSQLVRSVNLPLSGAVRTIRLNASRIPCISGDTLVCYQVAEFVNTIVVDNNSAGYTLAWGRCCRVDRLGNLEQGSGVGAMYTTQVPGSALVNDRWNTSPEFNVRDTSLVCAGKNFSLDFGATDADGDSLSYAFTDAYNGGSQSPNGPPPATFTTTPLMYAAGYSGVLPLGSLVVINQVTGVISGIAPGNIGRYVVNVTVTEWRNGVAINRHRKDFVLKVGDCSFIEAVLSPKINCNNLTVNFENESTSSNIQSYRWDFGVPNTQADTSTQPTPTFTYADTGTYNVTLRVEGSDGCAATANTTVKVYPGFNPGFTYNTLCYRNPIQFTDTSNVRYGTITARSWNFGDLSTLADTSNLANPTYTYNSVGTRTVVLQVVSSKGCFGTVTKTLNLEDAPFIGLSTDTLMCRLDSLQLATTLLGANYTVQWQPAQFIINPTSIRPIVFPPNDTRYTVQVTEGACTGQASILVRVINNVTLTVNSDTSICRGDSIMLLAAGNATSYRWEPANLFSNAAVATPKVVPTAPNNTYTVTAAVGRCIATAQIQVATFPYPLANAGKDSFLCSGTSMRLIGAVQANSFAWLPAVGLSNTNSLSPIVAPINTTQYILSATGNQGCPKTVFDTVTIQVIPPVSAFAGNDTAIVEGQPLQLFATGGETYLWSPATWLNNATISNPILRIPVGFDSVRLRVQVSQANGCFASDDIKVVVFNTAPDIFIPTGFTPNADGRNDVLKAIPVGIQQFTVFSVFNRYGQVVFTTQDASKGWDGNFNGIAQPSGTYVFMAQGVDFTGRIIQKKGTVVLIR
ncbi:MAG: PKD domain-containing protein [Chitinophagaceae bacterium]